MSEENNATEVETTEVTGVTTGSATTPADSEETATNVEQSSESSESESSVIRQMRKELKNANKQLKDYQAKEKERDFAKMSKEQREKAEFDEQRSKFEAEKAEFERAKHQVQISDDLAEKGLPKSFAKALTLIEDNEDVLQLIEEAVEEQNNLIEKRTRELLSGKPLKVNGGTNGVVTKELFDKMTIAERTKLYQQQPELYNKLKL